MTSQETVNVSGLMLQHVSVPWNVKCNISVKCRTVDENGNTTGYWSQETLQYFATPQTGLFLTHKVYSLFHAARTTVKLQLIIFFVFIFKYKQIK